MSWGVGDWVWVMVGEVKGVKGMGCLGKGWGRHKYACKKGGSVDGGL